MKPNDTLPDAAPNDTEPGDAPDGGQGRGTDPIWPPRSNALPPRESARLNEAERGSTDPDWYLEGFRGRPHIVARRQAESEGRSGAVYDVLALPAKRVEPVTAPNAAVIVNATPAPPPPLEEPPALSGALPPVEAGARGIVSDEPARPSPKRPFTTVPAARRVLAVRRIVNVTALVAAAFAVTSVLVIVARTGRRPGTQGVGSESTMPLGSVDASAERTMSNALGSSSSDPSAVGYTVSTEGLATEALPTAAPGSSTPSTAIASLRAPVAPSTPPPPSSPMSPRPPSAASTEPGAPASKATEPRHEGPRKNDGVRQL